MANLFALPAFLELIPIQPIRVFVFLAAPVRVNRRAEDFNATFANSVNIPQFLANPRVFLVQLELTEIRVV